MGESKKRGIFYIKNRKGSQVGIIVSFMIFITFIVFLYAVLKPAINVGEDKSLIATQIENEIVQNTSLNLTSISININTGITENCIELENFFTLALRDEISYPYQVIAKNETGNIQRAYYSPGYTGGLGLENLNKNNNAYNSFFKIYYSLNFSGLEPNNEKGDTTGCQPLSYGSSNNNYAIGTIDPESYIFNGSIKELADYYNAHYDALKTNFKIPEGTEFGFEFVDTTGANITAEQETNSKNVYVNQFPVQYFDDNANIESGFINVKVW